MAERIDSIVIDKSARRLTVYRARVAMRSYDVALGFAPMGDKRREGDGKTPEGVFRVNRRNPRSSFHLSLGLDYPLATDRARAEAGGYDPGGDIFIHGQEPAFAGRRRAGDWTEGCIAVSNAEIEELWRVVSIAAVVEIRP